MINLHLGTTLACPSHGELTPASAASGHIIASAASVRKPLVGSDTVRPRRATRWNGTARVVVATVARRRGCMLGAPVLRSAVRDGRGPQG